MSHTEGLPGLGSSKYPLLSDPESEIDEDDVADTSEQILYTASFDKLAENNLQYDTIIWMSISLLLVLAWGVGIIMLLYLPFKRYVLQKDISSRKLHVTPTQIVYQVCIYFFVKPLSSSQLFLSYTFSHFCNCFTLSKNSSYTFCTAHSFLAKRIICL